MKRSTALKLIQLIFASQSKDPICGRLEAEILNECEPDTKTPEERIAEYERILKTIVHDLNNALCFVDRSSPPNEPFGLDYRTLKHWIDEALK